jgi:DNA-binding XRE family transcriptional regulator
MTVDLCNLKSVRGAIGKTQSQMAALLGVSLRAVQSYEQRWRETPLHVQKMAALLLYLDWRRGRGDPRPCWTVTGCAKELRRCCAAHQFGAGDLCWLVNGTRCRAKEHLDWQDKIKICQKCKVTKAWLSR